MNVPVKKKILTNVWIDLIGPLNGKVGDACLNRDAYLNRVFLSEAEILGDEVTTPNSKEAKAYLSQQMTLLDRKPVNFSFSSETVEAINDVCAKKNIPRDSFINRVIFLLLVNDPDKFDAKLSNCITDHWPTILKNMHHEWPEADPIKGGLSMVTAIVGTNPFWAIRASIEASRSYCAKEGVDPEDWSPLLSLMEVRIKRGKVMSKGLNCFLPDHLVEGSRDHKRWQDTLNALSEVW